MTGVPSTRTVTHPAVSWSNAWTSTYFQVLAGMVPAGAVEPIGRPPALIDMLPLTSRRIEMWSDTPASERRYSTVMSAVAVLTRIANPTVIVFDSEGGGIGWEIRSRLFGLVLVP